jgi:predicted Rossmann-fold nucleotide-binding protein
MQLEKIPYLKVLKKNDDTEVKVFVCGGGSNINEMFYKDAYQVGKKLAELGTGFANGGYTERGTNMGESYFGYKENGGNHSSLVVRKVFNEDIKSEYDSIKQAAEVDDIAELIKAQYLMSDIVVILPGGTGTLIELLGYIELPLDYANERPKTILFNKKIDEKNGFFDLIKKQIELMRRCGFVSKNPFKEFKEVSTIDELLITLEEEVKRIEQVKSDDLTK